MCEHHHENYKSPIKRVILALLALFIAMFIDNEAKLLPLILAYLLASTDILVKAFKNILKGKVFDENFLMSIATIGAIAIKEYHEAIMVMVLYQIGEYFQHKAVKKSRHSITKLMDIRPDYANVEENGQIRRKNPEYVKINETIVVNTGEKIPLDGTITDGHAAVDTSALTGESIPQNVKAGDTVISGCINLNGVLKIKVEKEVCDSTVSKILEMVEHASHRKAKTENFITKFARFYTPAVVICALILAFVPPLFIEEAAFQECFKRALTFLVISCPCALVISIPLSFFAGIGGASKCGILIKGSSCVETLSNPDTIVFDKTGTLTEGIFRVTEINPLNISKEELLKYTAYAEHASNHPIAISLKAAYGEEIDHTQVSDITDIAGKGIKAIVQGQEVLVGNKELFEEYNIETDDKEGTTVYVAVNKTYCGSITISDRIKDDAYSAIPKLSKLVKNIVMLTGDTKKAAQKVKDSLKIDQAYAQLLPIQKVEKLEEIIVKKEKGKSVIFVGDGINDAPVLARADIGIAMGALGSDAAIEAADIVIMDDKITNIVSAIKIAKKTFFIVKENIIFAIGIKVLFLILGAFGIISMWGAVFADVGVSVIAIMNAMRALIKPAV